MSEEIDTTLAVARFAPVLNVLEMTFCRAFQSLPGCVLTDIFGPGDYSDVGLNNLPPSFEGRNVPAHLRTKNTGYHRQSPDVDIASFPDARKKQLLDKRNTLRRPAALLKADYLQAMEQVAEEANLSLKGFFHFSESLEKVSKVLIASPQPLVAAFRQKVDELRQLRDVLGLAQALTSQKLKYTSWENACFFAALFAQRRREKDENAEPLTALSLCLVYRDWLHYRGFVNDEDIQELERIFGDLTLALLWITGFLANRSKRCDGSDLMCDRGYRGKYGLEAYRKTKELFDRIYEKRLAAVGVFYGRQEEADIREALQDADLAMTKDGIWISRCYDCDDGVIAEGVTEGVAMDITDNIVEDDAEDPAEDGDWDIRKDIAEDVIVRLVGDLDLNAGAYSDEGNDHNLEFTCRNDSLRFK
ncbi:hypothetical protein UCRPA7_6325 [Phaeoacremonium minimum UCRPA7]|uniref:Uncharacterized protein n=1 Tax=Phaeoacremonium minimum (strain UCR-PA7) TaxID=1286976 RepID=R8BFX3_PHAM7|nr:hypothetical protein UCRPA7_6325 [Phaeoacremonium minimum UCRPA7]EON98189.1 hypothetical protein UCRPA7_6325 [Phaeoacremonium minimum UCRPA7]